MMLLYVWGEKSERDHVPDVRVELTSIIATLGKKKSPLQILYL